MDGTDAADTPIEPNTNTYGSRGIARYRIAQLDREGVLADAPVMRAALGRWAALMGHPRPEDEHAADAYDEEMMTCKNRESRKPPEPISDNLDADTIEKDLP